MTGTAGRIERMISDITALVGDIPGPVRAAFQAMPRHLFIPPVALVDEAGMTAGIDRHADPAAWMNAVYSDMPIVTQLADGAVPMMMRSQRPATTPDDRRGEHTTTVDPRTIAAAPAGANLAMAAITGLGCYSYREDDTCRVVVTDPPTGNWSVATWRPGRDEYTVRQAGGRPLWEEAVDAYFRWMSWGEPGRDRFGMTVTPKGQQVWLDTPERPVTP
ncbi:hypothetical protein C1I98_28760 [Spongiactinospora gelatinilytica]|uniref:Uncharacterized protein n=1 Tax=Spongiactinospora gelatinilytica TaxID=2666298 RepID=A0A2W2GGY5_9ACTN|nr:hypothetical protein [Spongiactinospora gelatinilytica]PZG33507.1 hypothetical protein C1I98_28760 [Spongiactinospora gelatinilytica]